MKLLSEQELRAEVSRILLNIANSAAEAAIMDSSADTSALDDAYDSLTTLIQSQKLAHGDEQIEKEFKDLRQALFVHEQHGPKYEEFDTREYVNKRIAEIERNKVAQ